MFRTNKKRLNLFIGDVDKKFPQVTDVLRHIICKYYQSLVETFMYNCQCKANRKFKGKICDPYSNNSHSLSTVVSNNLLVSNHKEAVSKSRDNYLVQSCNKLSCSNRVDNISTIDLPKNVGRLLGLGETFNLPFSLDKGESKNKKLRSVLADSEGIIDSLDITDSGKDRILNRINEVFCRFIKRGGINKQCVLYDLIC